MSYIKLSISPFAGHNSTFRSRYISWLLKRVPYVGVRRLQSAGEAQTGPVGYQTDTRHIRAALRG
jgi:hypothetical protein